MNLVHDLIVAGAEMLDGGDKEDKSNVPLTERSVDYAITAMAEEDRYKFSRIVIYTDRSKNGKNPKLKNTEGETFEIPERDATPVALATAFIKWMKMDESEIEEIDREILAVNAMPTARHTLPKEYLTEQEKTDPNS
jgi:hypothetical protein